MPHPASAFVTDEEWTTSVTALLEEGRADLALHTLARAAGQAGGGRPVLPPPRPVLAAARRGARGQVGGAAPPSAPEHSATARTDVGGDRGDPRRRAEGALPERLRGWALSQEGHFTQALEALAPDLDAVCDTEGLQFYRGAVL
ncbi:hypothetical protein [Deinococcus apachensis]|uniref:hypothetical protein n=1 Tax=Deinococcus apachensis TaxID=309886 RepID=UPI0012F97F54|nr:hypothetical protein [Deinococcus apachensis]